MIARRSLTVLLLVVSSAACGGGPDEAEGARVARSAFSVHDEQIGVGAIVRVDDDTGRRDIGLSFAFYAGGRRLATERDMLPFCPARTDCPWGRALFGEHLGPGWRSVDRVRVTVTDRGHATDDDLRISELDADAGASAVRVDRIGVEGTAYVIASREGVPRSGYSFLTDDGERTPLRFTQRIFPRARGDDIHAYLYPGSVPDRE